MSETYDFGNLSPIEFEALCVDLVSEETGANFERFSSGADGGVDGRHSTGTGSRILQAKHYKNSTWSDLKRAAKREHSNLVPMAPSQYYFATSLPLTPERKTQLHSALNHPSVSTGNIWGQAELNDRLRKYPKIERRHIKLWLSSAGILEKIVHNDIAIFTEATEEEIARVLKVYVENPSLQLAADVLEKRHSLIISGPPGVGKTTLAQVLAAEYCDDGWDLVAISEIEQAFSAFKADEKQVFVFDDFLGKIKLDPSHLSRSEGRIFRLIESFPKQKNKRFIMTTRSYVLEAARDISDVLNDERIDLSEVVLDLSVYTREIRARILYNHLYHSDLSQGALNAVIADKFPKRIIDHRNYMPRIVQWMTELSGIEGVSDAAYPEYFLRTLDSPDKVWNKAFRKHISNEARLLLFSMYFIDRESFPNPGVPIKRLRELFISVDRMSRHGDLPQSTDRRFEEALREVKSSFVVVDADKANFINPSILDFLSKEVVDVDILECIAMGACQIDEVRRVWDVATNSYPAEDVRRERIAKAIEGRVTAGGLAGRLAFGKAAKLLGELLLATESGRLIGFVRAGGLADQVWVNETDLVSVIEDVEEGGFRTVPHASAYGRLLRGRLYNYVIDREYVLDLDEVTEILESVSQSFVEFPQSFLDALDEAVTEAIDTLDPYRLATGEDAETVLGGWLEQIEKIESTSSHSVDREKKREIEESLTAIEMQRESMMEDYRERTHFHGVSSNANPLLDGRQAETFTDRDLSSLFSSLKSRDS